MRTESPFADRLARAAPWLLGLAGTLVFLRPLAGAPATTLLERVFWYDAFVNVGDLGALHEHFSKGLQGQGFYDWLYGAPFFFPQPRALVISELMPLAALVTWPLGDAAVLSHNVLLAACCVLNTVAGASFARALGGRPWTAALAGAAFAFSAYTNFQSGRLQLLMLFPLAFAYARTLRWARTGSLRDALAAALWAFALVTLCLYYAMFLALSLPVVALVARLADRRPGARRDLARLGGAFLLAVVPAVALLWPYRELRSALGLARPIGELVDQSGDFMMFLWADDATIWRAVIPDVYKWDTAYFPGLVVLAGAVAGLVLWVRGDRKPRARVLIVISVGALLSPLLTFSSLLVALVVAVVLLVRLAREGRTTPLAPALLALATVGVLLFGGVAPRAWGVSLGPSPFAWMFEHVPFLDGLRMIRRAGLLVNLAVLGVAVLALSRLEARRHGRMVVAGLALLALLEGMPGHVAAREVPTICSDPAMIAARRLGAGAVADLSPTPPKHAALALRRQEAMLCGVATTLGPAGFVPLVADVASDAASSLPSVAAHAWLWERGLRAVVLRGDGNPAWTTAALRRLEPVTAIAEHVGADHVVLLKPPPLPTELPPAHLLGPRVPITGATCLPVLNCGGLFDGDETTRWTSFLLMNGTEHVELRFAPTTVTGLEWHGTGCAADLPRGLRIESEAAPGVWEPWRELPSISQAGLGREAVRPSLAIMLPPRKTGAIRLSQTGWSTRYWLSASELQVVGAR